MHMDAIIKCILETILSFAERIGVAPGVVVGRLQHDGHLGFNRMNQLKMKFCRVEAG